jgi:hypothetical protein
MSPSASQLGELFGDDDARDVGKARLHHRRSCTPLTYRLRSVCVVAVGFIVPLGVYIASLRPGVDYWDTGELQTVPFILGIAHPSGFPAYVLIGWLWSHVVPFGDPAYRMNLLSAVAMATAAAALTATLLELAVEPICAGGDRVEHLGRAALEPDGFRTSVVRLRGRRGIGVGHPQRDHPDRPRCRAGGARTTAPAAHGDVLRGVGRAAGRRDVRVPAAAQRATVGATP